MRLITSNKPLDIQGKILTRSELTNAFENLEKRRQNVLETFNQQLDEPFREKKKKSKFNRDVMKDPLFKILQTNQ